MTDLMNQEIREYNVNITETGEPVTAWGIRDEDGTTFIPTVQCKDGHITQNIHLQSSGFTYCEGGATYCHVGFDEFVVGVNCGVKPPFKTAMERAS